MTTSSIDPNNIYFNDGVHQYDFATYIDLYPSSTVQPNTTTFKNSLLNALLADTGPFPAGGGLNGATSMSDAFAEFIQTVTPGTPYTFPDGSHPSADTWNKFIESWVKYYRYNITGTDPSGIIANTQPGPDISVNNLYNFFLNTFLATQGSTYNPGTNTLSGDLSLLATNFSFAGGTDRGTTTVSNNPFIKSFNNNIGDILSATLAVTLPSINANPPLPLELINLLLINTFIKQSIIHYLTATTTINPPVPDLGPNSIVSAAALNALPSYKSVYQQFGPPNATEADFEQSVKDFYLSEVHKNGYFIPSRSFADWSQKVRNDNQINATSPNGLTSLAGNSSEKVSIINRILALLIRIIKSLQDIAIAQSNHITFRTKYQEAYTGLQKQVPVFLIKDTIGTPYKLRTTGTDESSARNDINSVVNSNLIDNLRALRGLQEDAAKKEQADINQTTDAVNQQTDMASNFIQQLTTLLSTIFK